MDYESIFLLGYFILLGCPLMFGARVAMMYWLSRRSRMAVVKWFNANVATALAQCVAFDAKTPTNQAVNRSGEVGRFQMDNLSSPPGYGRRYAADLNLELLRNMLGLINV
jgi:hypothetical protein